MYELYISLHKIDKIRGSLRGLVISNSYFFNVLNIYELIKGIHLIGLEIYLF